MDRTVQDARERGYVETLSGRRRYFPDLKSGNQALRGNAERAVINTPFQGTAAATTGFDRVLGNGTLAVDGDAVFRAVLGTRRPQ